MGWKSDTSLATQNKNDDLSDNIDNIDDNLKQLFFNTKIRSYALATKIFKNNEGIEWDIFGAYACYRCASPDKCPKHSR